MQYRMKNGRKYKVLASAFLGATLIMTPVSLADTLEQTSVIEQSIASEAVISLQNEVAKIEALKQYKIESAQVYDQINALLSEVNAELENGTISRENEVLKKVGYTLSSYLKSDSIDFSTYMKVGNVSNSKEMLIASTDKLINFVGEMEIQTVVDLFDLASTQLSENLANKIESEETYRTLNDSVLDILQAMESNTIEPSRDLRVKAVHTKENVDKPRWEALKDSSSIYTQIGDVDAIKAELFNNLQILFEKNQVDVTVYVTPITQYGQTVTTTDMSYNSSYTKIQVKYGTHTYGSNNQEEYDKVLAVVEKAVADAQKEWDEKGDKLFEDGLTFQHRYDILTRGFEGKTMSQKDKDDFDYLALVYYRGLSLDEIKWAWFTDVAFANILEAEGQSSSLDGESAYSYLFEDRGDCNSRAYLNQVLYDVLGKNTRIVKDRSHAWAQIQINSDVWYSVAGGVSMEGAQTTGILVAPTW